MNKLFLEKCLVSTSLLFRHSLRFATYRLQGICTTGCFIMYLKVVFFNQTQVSIQFTIAFHYLYLLNTSVCLRLR